MNTQNPISDTRGTILGATGLPRGVLADLFRRRGLFGRDSQLGTAEQAVVQGRLPAIDGLAPLPVPALQTPRLKALAAYVDALVAGRDARVERGRVQAEGVSRPAIEEAAVTVDNVRAVFGPLAGSTAPLMGATGTGPQAAPQYARAA